MTENMIEIMKELHKYVPKAVAAANQEGDRPGVSGLQGDQPGVSGLQQMCFGGDQLTVARAQKGITVRANSQDPSSALRGLVPVAADWHSKVNFTSVSCEILLILCSSASSRCFYF